MHINSLVNFRVFSFHTLFACDCHSLYSPPPHTHQYICRSRRHTVRRKCHTSLTCQHASLHCLQADFRASQMLSECMLKMKELRKEGRMLILKGDKFPPHFLTYVLFLHNQLRQNVFPLLCYGLDSFGKKMASGPQRVKVDSRGGNSQHFRQFRFSFQCSHFDFHQDALYTEEKI